MNDEDLVVRVFMPADQAQHMFGLTWANKHLANERSAWAWALKEGARGYDYQATNLGWDDYVGRYAYNSLLLLASAIQMAGPHLTPETLARGLQRTRFPNPDCGGGPDYQACVGFTPSSGPHAAGADDHVFYNDAAVFWYSPSERAVNDGEVGAVCYARRGARFPSGGMPETEDGVFTLPCQ